MPDSYRDLSSRMPDDYEAVFYQEVTSTNDVARQRVSEGHKGPIWVASAAQTAGRGRLGRPWVSEKGNLYTSLMIRPDEKPDKMVALPFLVALAVRRALIMSGANGNQIKCKWPNDILFNEKKVAGILIESSMGSRGAIDFLIIGIGTNLNVYPEEAQFPATCFARETESYIDPEAYFVNLAAAFDMQWRAWQQFGFEPIRDDWLRHSWGMGEKRMIRTSNLEVTARLQSLDKDGALIIKLDDGTEKSLYAGDIFASE